MKEYALLHCKYFGNLCQKPKMKREGPPFKTGKKSPPTIARAASPALGPSFVSVC